MLRQNETLRRSANRARVDASKSNEALLNRIGSDLHDGPVQLLSLLILRLDSAPLPPNLSSAVLVGHTEIAINDLTPLRLASQVLTELRELSTGLVLPEIESLSLEATFRTAVERHEYTTGSLVQSHYHGLPKHVAYPLKICLYRVVQEGLNNAFRHGAARDQRVSASADDKTIIVTISDAGPGMPRASENDGRGKPLALQGMRNRLETFGGSLQILARDSIGTELVVMVPIDGNNV